MFLVCFGCKNVAEKETEQIQIVVDSTELKIKTVKRQTNKLNTFSLLEKSVPQDWVRENPKIKKTEPSFFNKENQNKYLIFEINFDGKSIPFSWDCDLSILNHLSKYDINISTEERKFKELIYNETEIKLKENIPTLIWTNEKIFRTKVSEWFLTNYFDCPETISFPSIRFEKIFELENARTNMQKGIAILPFDNSINKISQSEIELLTIENNILKGIGYDINNDKINDIFCFYEELDEEGFTGYKRLYINVNGYWTCKWIEYYEECI